jgi:integrase
LIFGNRVKVMKMSFVRVILAFKWVLPTGSAQLAFEAFPLTPRSIVNWFAEAYRTLNLAGCSSHSGRRTFITRAARLVHQAGGSLRDVQLLAGHRDPDNAVIY